MSSTSTPIPPTSFALAIRDLPLPNLHLKAAELRNSIAHLQYSNIELNRWADDGDRDCAEAMRENEVTIGRMEERIGLLRKEVEGRGMRWAECEGEGEVADDGVVDGGEGEATVVEERMEGRREERRGGGGGERNGRRPGGSLNDEELARRLREQMGEEEDGDESGVHL